MTLIDRLTRLAELWSAASGKSLSRLATRVANDGKLFQRIGGGAAVTTPTFERFLQFFRDTANWPDAGMPDEAAELLDELKAISPVAQVEASPASDVREWPIGKEATA